MDFCSKFYKNHLFGKYPTNSEASQLEKMGVTLFVDLTSPDENLPEYELTKAKKIKFEMKDGRIPDDMTEFKILVDKLVKTKKLMYIHCRGGHGRAGLVVACYLVKKLNINAEKALELTYKYHQNRKEMKPKWRKLGSPQTIGQKNFVKKFDITLGRKVLLWVE